MSSGILLKGVNSVFFRNWLDLIFEFIPQIIFMICTFGFMDYMIVFKWLHSYDPAVAPSIITLLINMALDPFAPSNPPLWGDGTSEQ
jgi:V-type H+-transporting ATPase subunit a